MQTYKPRLLSPGMTLEAVIAHLNTELQSVQKAANASNDSLDLRFLNAAPAKPQDGSVYNADGTNWNPGSGKGSYRYNASSGTYTFLG